VHHVSESLHQIEAELRAAKHRHPASWKDDDPHPVKDKHGEGWKRLWHNVILFDRRAG
jgi:hypothetical protein